MFIRNFATKKTASLNTQIKKVQNDSLLTTLILPSTLEKNSLAKSKLEQYVQKINQQCNKHLEKNNYFNTQNQPTTEPTLQMRK